MSINIKYRDNNYRKYLLYNVICLSLAIVDLLGVWAVAQMMAQILKMPITFEYFYTLTELDIFLVIIVRLVLIGALSYLLNLISLQDFDTKICNSLSLDNEHLFLNFNNSSEIDAKYGVSRWGYINTFLIPKNNLAVEIYTVIILMTALIASVGFVIIVITGVFALIISAMYFCIKLYTKHLARVRFELEQKNTQQIQDIFQLRYFMWDGAVKDYFFAAYISLLSKISKITASEHLSINSSRYLLEATMSFCLLIVIAKLPFYDLNNLVLIAVGAFRLMPSAVRISSSFQSIGLSTQFRKVFNSKMIESSISSVSLKSNEGGYVLTICQYNYFGKSIDKIINIPTGSIVVIDGKSGCGKSYLFDCIIRSLSKEINYNFGYMPQDTPLCKGGIADNILIGRTYDKSRLDYALDRSGLKDEFATDDIARNRDFNLPSDKLSGGQRKRLGLARCLFNLPKILFLDEPTAGLDNEAANSICDSLLTLNFDIMFVISHDDKVKSIGSNFIKLSRDIGSIEVFQCL